jgi:ribosome-associated toxin RatA of RatAB toxin-antitoxin module
MNAFKRIAGLGLVAGSVMAATCHAGSHTVSVSQLDAGQLSESQVAITDLSAPSVPGKSFAAATLMNAPVQKLCSLITDYTAYPSFMPNTDKTRVSYAGEDYAVIDMTLKLPLGKIKKYRLRMELQSTPQACHLAWKMIPWEELKPDETIGDTSGYWHLTPHPSNRSKTVVEYFVYADPGPVPFGLGWIVDMMSKESLPRTLEAVREKAASLQ